MYNREVLYIPMAVICIIHKTIIPVLFIKCKNKSDKVDNIIVVFWEYKYIFHPKKEDIYINSNYRTRFPY